MPILSRMTEQFTYHYQIEVSGHPGNPSVWQQVTPQYRDVTTVPDYQATAGDIARHYIEDNCRDNDPEMTVRVHVWPHDRAVIDYPEITYYRTVGSVWAD